MAIVRNGEILLVRQNYRGELIWTFPGGRIEPGETAEAAAIREVQEETGLTVRAETLLYQTRRSTGQGIYFCYLGEIIAGEAKLGSDPELPPGQQELKELCWFPIQAVQDHREVSRIQEAIIPYLESVSYEESKQRPGDYDERAIDLVPECVRYFCEKYGRRLNSVDRQLQEVTVAQTY